MENVEELIKNIKWNQISLDGLLDFIINVPSSKTCLYDQVDDVGQVSPIFLLGYHCCEIFFILKNGNFLYKVH